MLKIVLRGLCGMRDGEKIVEDGPYHILKIISNTRMAPSTGAMVFSGTCSLGTNCSGSADWGDHSLKVSVRMCLRLLVSIP